MKKVRPCISTCLLKFSVNVPMYIYKKGILTKVSKKLVIARWPYCPERLCLNLFINAYIGKS